jgi:dihydroorotase
LTLRLVEEGLLTLAGAVALLTHKPADILGVDAGELGVGATADVCIFNPAESWMLTEDGLVSRGRNTPFIGWQLRGRVTHTLVGGKLVFERP